MIDSNLINIIKAENKRIFSIKMRYKVEAFGGVFIALVTFFLLLQGLSLTTNADMGLGDTKEGLYLGFLCWLILVGGISQIVDDIEDNAKLGTLESLFLSVHSPVRILYVRSIVSLLWGIPLILIFGIVGHYVINSELTFSSRVIFPLVALDLTATGFSFFLGGLALIYKRVQPVVVLCQLMAIASLFPYNYGSFEQELILFAPVLPVMQSIRDIILKAELLNVLHLYLLIVNGFVYLMAGVYFFRWAISSSKKSGGLSQH